MAWDCKPMRETRAILANLSVQEAFNYVEEMASVRPIQTPRLWKLISDTALEKLDFPMAQKAFVRSMDYKGLQFLKRIEKLDDKDKQRAEVAVYFGHIEAAEKIYLEMDRKDLAIHLRTQMGDWFRVVQLIKSGGSGDDAMLEKAWNSIGDYYYERQRWWGEKICSSFGLINIEIRHQAITYYSQGKHTERLIECFYMVEDYDSLEKIIYSLPETSHFLLVRAPFAEPFQKFSAQNIAEKFVSVGLCDQAVSAFIKSGDVKSAIDTCVQLHKWNMEVELADEHRFQGIEAMLAEYATRLLENGKILTAIELFRKANYCQKSAKLLFTVRLRIVVSHVANSRPKLAEEATKDSKNPLRIKKFYVLAALEVERYHQLSRKAGVEKEMSALEGLLAEDSAGTMETKFLDNVWRGAEAYHFYILAQRQFYSGNISGSMRTKNKKALHLRNYDDIIEPKVIYGLLALASFHNNHFAVCSSAFIKLEALEQLNEEEKARIENLALSIFTRREGQFMSLSTSCVMFASIVPLKAKSLALTVVRCQDKIVRAGGLPWQANNANFFRKNCNLQQVSGNHHEVTSERGEMSDPDKAPKKRGRPLKSKPKAVQHTQVAIAPRPQTQEAQVGDFLRGQQLTIVKIYAVKALPTRGTPYSAHTSAAAAMALTNTETDTDGASVVDPATQLADCLGRVDELRKEIASAHAAVSSSAALQHVQQQGTQELSAELVCALDHRIHALMQITLLQRAIIERVIPELDFLPQDKVRKQLLGMAALTADAERPLQPHLRRQYLLCKGAGAPPGDATDAPHTPTQAYRLSGNLNPSAAAPTPSTSTPTRAAIPQHTSAASITHSQNESMSPSSPSKRLAPYGEVADSLRKKPATHGTGAGNTSRHYKITQESESASETDRIQDAAAVYVEGGRESDEGNFYVRGIESADVRTEVGFKSDGVVSSVEFGVVRDNCRVRFAYIGGKGAVQVWDLADTDTRDKIRRISTVDCQTNGHVRVTRTLNGNRNMLIGGEFDEVLFCDPETTAIVTRLTIPTAPNEDFAYMFGAVLSADSRYAVSVHGGGSVHLWDAHARQIAWTLGSHEGVASSCGYIDDAGASGGYFVSGGVDARLRVWDTRGGTSSRSSAEHFEVWSTSVSGPVHAMTCDPVNGYCVIGYALPSPRLKN
ncbi:WD repeat-containing protein 35 [Entophlyctis luteolus]|nr:WD repeat-containing protein 35 [Entophlyctis luteolus]